METRDFSSVKRIVIKVGTNTLSQGNTVDMEYIRDLSEQIAQLKKMDYEVLLITSGAIGMGAGELGIKGKISSIPKRQACAAVGQPLLMHAYKLAFAPLNVQIAQVLLTSDVLSHRGTYLNLRNAVETMLQMGVLPIFNENDNISTAEIGNAFGDNDKLSALIASKVDADLLILLTDIDSLYNKNPRHFPDAKAISMVEDVTQELLEGAGEKGRGFSTGGMRSKLQAVLIAQKSGTPVVLAHGRSKGILGQILKGAILGTFFQAKIKLRNKTRWMLHADPQGDITVDEGAMLALRQGKNSLLPKGVKHVQGHFLPGAVVMVNHVLKIITRLSSEELRKTIGMSSQDMEQILGRREVIARPEEMVFLESTLEAEE